MLLLGLAQPSGDLVSSITSHALRLILPHLTSHPHRHYWGPVAVHAVDVHARLMHLSFASLSFKHSLTLLRI
jgi:hypothetical protein